jgi:hypothetical protein
MRHACGWPLIHCCSYIFQHRSQYPDRLERTKLAVLGGMRPGEILALQWKWLTDHSVFDAGTTANGRPYFVMELVNGIPVTQYSFQAA